VTLFQQLKIIIHLKKSEKLLDCLDYLVYLDCLGYLEKRENQKHKKKSRSKFLGLPIVDIIQQKFEYNAE